METTRIEARPRPIENVVRELSNLVDRIENRMVWLNNSENKMRSTYSVVARDTRQMIEKADDLKREIEQIEGKQPNSNNPKNREQ